MLPKLMTDLAHSPPSRAATARSAIVILLAVVALESAVRSVRPITGTDAPTVLCMVAKDGDESLFSRDAYFNTLDHYKGYIPAYRGVLRLFAAIGGSPWQGMLILFPLVLCVVLLGVWLVAREAVGPVWIAIPIAIAASFVRDTGGGWYWGMTWAVEPLARFIFLGLALFGFLPLLRSWPKVSVKAGMFSLAAVGVLGNVHPPSAVGWFLVIVALLLLADASWKKKLATLATGIPVALLAGLPTMIATLHRTLRQTGSLHPLFTIRPFEKMVEAVLSVKEGIFPWVMRPLREGGFYPNLKREWLWYFLAAYIVCMILWALCYGLRNRETRSSRASWMVLLLIQIPCFFILSRLRAVDLVLVLAAYLLLRRKEGTVSRMEWLAATLLSCIVGIAWTVSPVLRLVWQFGEQRWLTQLVINFGRFSKFAYLPVWILVALWARARWSRTTALPLVAMFIALVYPWRGTVAFFALTILGVVCTEYYARRMPAFAARLIVNAMLIAALVLGVAYYNDGIAPRSLKLLLAAASGAVALCAQWAVSCGGFRRWASVTAAVLVLGATGALGRNSIPAELGRAREYLLDTFTARGGKAAERDLFEWARTETAKDSLFYLSDDDRFAHRFRAMAQRSVVHTFKAALTPRELELPPAYRDHPQAFLEKPFREANPALLMDTARGVQADYVVVPATFPRLTGAGVAFENGFYRVWRL